MDIFNIPSEGEILSVNQVNSIVSDVIKDNYILSSLRVSGEIANFTRHSSGHIYLTLKDDLSRIRAIMFKHQAAYLKFTPSDGMKVVAKGSIQVYQRGGEYQLYITSMEQSGEGDLYAAFEALKKKLAEEGLFDAARKRKIPTFCRKIAVVTSPTGAAIRDILNIAKRRYKGIEIIVVPALVQGVDAPESIVDALNTASLIPGLDCVILARGGGSSEELWAFNDEAVARTITKMPYPVVSAIGHEIDFVITDFVADYRAPTPSAAAEIVVPNAEEISMYIRGMHDKLKRLLAADVERKRSRLEFIMNQRALSRPAELIAERRISLDEIVKGMDMSILSRIDSFRKLLSEKNSVLRALDPKAVFDRGYAIVQNTAGDVVTDVNGVVREDKIKILLKTGSIAATVDDIVRTEG